MSFSNPRQSCLDILQHIELIQKTIAGLTKDSLASDAVRRAAIERWLQIITEAAFRIGKNPDQLCPGPDWAGLRGLGNRLRHAYDSLDIDLIWIFVTEELAPLQDAVTACLAALNPQDDA